MKTVPILVGCPGLKFGDVNLNLSHEIVLSEWVLVPDHHSDNAVHREGTLKSELEIFLPSWKSSFVYYLNNIHIEK